MTGTPEPPPHRGAQAQAAALRAEFPRYAVNVLHRRGDRPRFEVVSRDGSNPYCLISIDALEIWRELQKADQKSPRTPSTEPNGHVPPVCPGTA